MIGKIVNYRYEVLEKVGDGPLFSVYKSRDKVLNRLVALKTPARGLAETPGLGEAVVTAYRGMMSLAHPNIAKALDADCVDGDCFVACEFARGINVKERVRRAGPIAAPLAVDIMIPVLSALEYAHSAGVVHGDLGAQDIIVSPDGEVKVTDFGLAGVLMEHADVADRYVMRSVHYQAPEMIEGAPPSVSSDVYSAGVILYEMLTGQMPFDGATSMAVAMKKVKETPPIPRTLNTAVPKSLSDIVMRAIEPSPSDRYPSAAAMLTELRGIREALRTGVPVGASTYGSGAQVARSAEEVEADVPERGFRSQFITLLVLFVVVCAVAMGATFMLKSQRGAITVPTMLGLTLEQARAEAEKAGVKLEETTGTSNTFPAGQICAVFPAAGSTVPANNPLVKVTVSSGSGEVQIPSVVGLTEPEATSAIIKAGFLATLKQQYDDGVPVGSVISQNPAANEVRPPSTSVNLVISLGPKPQVEQPVAPPDQPTQVGQERKFKVAVEVPADADGPQEVRIDVVDDNGENTVYTENREPGDKFTVPVTAYGDSVKIKTYVGGDLVGNETY